MNTAEETFYANLTDPDSLDVMIREGFTNEIILDIIPSEVGRKLTTWCIEQYFQSGRKVAPSKQAIMDTWGDQLTPLDIEINDEFETDSVHWAISQLRTNYVDFLAGEFSKSFATAVRQADPPDRPTVVQDYSDQLHMLAQAVLSRRNEMDGAAGLSDALARYEERAKANSLYDGITFGLKEIDDHILGVHPGELCIVASTSGGGKSWLAIWLVIENFKVGRKVILFTLENDVEMTYDRMACVYCHVDYEKWQRGECSDGDVQRVRGLIDLMEASPNKPIIAQPEEKEATGVAMVRRAIVEGADAIIIDQLSHVEPVAGSKARQRNEVVAEIVKDLYKQIKRTGTKIPCVLFHQINRKGRDEARKIGRYLMDHMGEATQVENAADLILAIYQSPDHEINGWAELQMLKGRRVRHLDWEIVWRPAVGDIRFRRTLDQGESDDRSTQPLHNDMSPV
jgi:KaiC/GvpD/RAD55 family RecA-like ATPase